jgi:ribosomal protein S18 acetylase RimI-like enzyme
MITSKKIKEVIKNSKLPKGFELSFFIDRTDGQTSVYLCMFKKHSYDEIIAIVRFGIYVDGIFISDLNVKKKFRKTGIGTFLVSISEELLKKFGCKEVSLYSESDWHMKWYESLGYKIIKDDKDYNSVYVFLKKEI